MISVMVKRNQNKENRHWENGKEKPADQGSPLCKGDIPAESYTMLESHANTQEEVYSRKREQLGQGSGNITMNIAT